MFICHIFPDFLTEKPMYYLSDRKYIMNRLIVLLLCLVMAFAAVGCSNNRARMETQIDDVRVNYEEASELYSRREQLFENTASYIFRDAGGFMQKNSGKDVLLQIDTTENRDDLRRRLGEYGFEGETVEDFITLFFDEQIRRIVWNGDESIDYFLYDGYSVICCSEFEPRKDGQLKDAQISQIDNNWFFVEALKKLQF